MTIRTNRTGYPSSSRAQWRASTAYLLAALLAPACVEQSPALEDDELEEVESEATSVAAAPQAPNTQTVPAVQGTSSALVANRPNVLVILLDDLGYSDLGTYGGEIRTPSIDSLAQEGTRFRNYYVTPRCSPTRASLLTGQYTHQVVTAPGDSLPPLRTDNNATIAETLSAAGYRTYLAGKWHLGTTDAQAPRARGFDHAFGIGAKAAGAGAFKWDKTLYGFLSKNSEIPARTYGDGPKAFYQSTAIGDYALDYLAHHQAKNDGAPFYMYLAFNAPHFPIQADSALVDRVPAGGQSYVDIYNKGWNQQRTERYQRMLNQGVIDSTYALSPREPFNVPEQNIPNWGTLSAAQKADLVRKQALYAASVEAVDTAIGRVVARLKATGQFDNTLIFVQSDNGGNYEGGVFGQAFGSATPVTGTQLANLGQPKAGDDVKVGGGWANVQNTPFRLFKHYTHGGGVRSPLVVSWPAKVGTPGAWTNQVAHVIDIVPTILEAAGVQHPTTLEGHAVLPLEGRSFVSSLVNPTTTQTRQLGFEHETNRAWIDGNFKLVVRHQTGDVPELYNLSTDPTELNDLSTAQPSRTQNLVKAWNAWATHVGVPAGRQL